MELLGLSSSMASRLRRVRAPTHMGPEGGKIANNLVVAGTCHTPVWEVVGGWVGGASPLGRYYVGVT